MIKYIRFQNEDFEKPQILNFTSKNNNKISTKNGYMKSLIIYGINTDIVFNTIQEMFDNFYKSFDSNYILLEGSYQIGVYINNKLHQYSLEFENDIYEWLKIDDVIIYENVGKVSILKDKCLDLFNFFKSIYYSASMNETPKYIKEFQKASGANEISVDLLHNVSIQPFVIADDFQSLDLHQSFCILDNLLKNFNNQFILKSNYADLMAMDYLELDNFVFYENKELYTASNFHEVIERKDLRECYSMGRLGAIFNPDIKIKKSI